jgi:hypothetical protein
MASAEFVGAASALNVGGGYVVNVGGVLNYAVGGLKSTQVGGAAVEVVGASRDETVGKDRNTRTQGDYEADVDGNVTLGAGADVTETIDGNVEISVPEGTVLLSQAGELQADTLKIVVNGKVALEMKKSGAVTLSGANVSVDASGAVTTKGGQVKKISGAAAAGGSAEVGHLQSERLDPKAAAFTLLDQDGKPVANQSFRVEFSDGSIRRGVTDSTGKATVPAPGPGSCKLFLVGVDPAHVTVRS